MAPNRHSVDVVRLWRARSARASVWVWPGVLPGPFQKWLAAFCWIFPSKLAGISRFDFSYSGRADSSRFEWHDHSSQYSTGCFLWPAAPGDSCINQSDRFRPFSEVWPGRGCRASNAFGLNSPHLLRLVAIVSSTSGNMIVALGTTAALDILRAPHFAGAALFSAPFPIPFVAWCR